MVGRTHYLNTDLDIMSAEDLTPLATFLGTKKWSVLHADWHPDGMWLGIFESPHAPDRDPERTIASMLKVLEALPEPLQRYWSAASKREFNIGYESGTNRRHFEQTLSNTLLRRVAAVGASISVTIYPPYEVPARNPKS